jgi:hypothetical protein
VLRRGPQWLIVPLGTGFTWMVTIAGLDSSLLFEGATWAAWLTMLGARVGISLTGWPTLSGRRVT